MRCLVLEPMPLVAEDLAMLIEECRPGTKVMLASSVTEAEAVLDAEGGCDVAFLNTDPEQLARTGLGLMLQGSGALVVFLGHEIEAARGSHLYLEVPVSGMAVMQALDLVLSSRKPSPSAV
jgi:hypothetical protein